MTTKLFGTPGNWITNSDLLESLKKVEAGNCDILYIHSGLSFGTPNPEMNKSDLLATILETLFKLNVKTLCVPTFTFSFCNGNDFDVENSKSKMGVFNEFFRKYPGAIRSVDPLMSVSLIGEDKDLVTGIGKESIGENSTFFKLHFRKNVKFLFLGTGLGDCFTYMHFIEKFLNVKYRYDREFSGKIINGNTSYIDTFTLFVRYKNIFPGKGSYTYEDLLIKNGFAKKEQLGNSYITCVNENPAFTVYEELINKDHNFFIDPSSVYDNNKSFEVTNMVAL